MQPNNGQFPTPMMPGAVPPLPPQEPATPTTPPPTQPPAAPTQPPQPTPQPPIPEQIVPTPAPTVNQTPAYTPPPGTNMPAFMNPNATSQPQPVVHVGGMPVGTFGARPAKKTKKRWLIPIMVVTVALLLAGSAAAYYNGIIGPTNPSNLWATAMSNTAKGYDKLIAYNREHQGDKGGELNGTFKVDSANFTTDGSFDAKWYDGNSTGKADIGLGTTRATLEFRTIKSASSYPDVYLKAGGIKGLGTQFGSQELEEAIGLVNDQWIAVDHTFIDNFQKEAAGGQATTGELTQDDINHIVDKVSESLKTYIFTPDTSKSVLVVSENVGKEDRDNRPTYHYKAGVDKQHLKDFVTDLKNKLNETKLKDMGLKSEDFDEMFKQIDQMDTNKVKADVWVDRQTKLFNAIRFSEDSKPETYLEFGTPYTGGDEYPFVFKVADEKSHMDTKITLDTKTNTTKVTVDADVQDEDPFKLNITMTAKSANTPVDVQKPAGAKSISEIFGTSPEQLIPTPVLPAREG